MYDARQIANWFVTRARRDDRNLSIMQLLKLVYIAHGWHLEMTGSPLIRNKIEAWKHGPVIPDVYNAFRPQGVYVSETARPFSNEVNPYAADVLEQIYNSYGQLPAGQLSDLTHEPGGPWEIATKRYGYFAPITNDIILPHYQMKRRRG
ncbi:Panacea domain-containing protein [Shinella sp.]|uniref:Panacea domain-containing protein n=1 Tax=Shinella sp. TaxID=1870904 RepID=UPI0029B4D8DF|nr:type II toxin-antitoxin system antitoxin SocA domain-containing protein [Shinella sp.]MDX3976140.1 DUF4065 domain-containing protein [Shinella sp.]